MGEDRLNESQERVAGARVNLCVTAGAGSGKTKTLVEYILRHLDEDAGRGLGPEGRSVSKVLALTYTDKAAAEMRGRLAKGIRGRLGEAERDGDPEREFFWSEEIRNLTQGGIGTIHSYAWSLVRRAGWALGIPRGLAPEPSEDDRDLMEALHDLLDAGDPAVMGILSQAPFAPRGRWGGGASLTGWLAGAEARVREWGLEGLVPGAGPGGLEAALAGMRDKAREFLGAVDGPKFAGGKADKKGAYREAVGGFLAFLEGWPEGGLFPEGADGFRPYGEAWGRLLGDLSALGYKQSQNNGYYRNELKALCGEVAGYEALAVCRLLCGLSGRLRDAAWRKRVERGAVSFSDMLAAARRVLRERPDVRREEHERWRLVVVDEFQDTNRLQADIIGYILQSPGEGGDGPAPFAGIDWAAAPLSLKVFGDHKQSIYRFRGAEPAVMQDLERRLGEAGPERGAVLSLDVNYRTVDRLISFFNAYFGEVFPGSVPQKPDRDTGYEGPAVTALLIPSVLPADSGAGVAGAASGAGVAGAASGAGVAGAASKAGGTGDKVKINSQGMARLEAGILARYLKGLFAGEESVRVFDREAREGEDPWRVPRFGDCAVLLRRKANSALFEEALKAAGIRANTLQGEDPFEDPAAAGLIAFWLALSGVEEDYNLAAALASPMGPVSDATLGRLCRPEAPGNARERLSSYFAGGRGFPEGLPPEELAHLESLKALFLALRGLAGRRPPGEAMELAAEWRGLVPLLFASREGGAPERVRGLQRVLETVKALPAGNVPAPESARDLVEDLFAADNRSGEGGPGDDREDGEGGAAPGAGEAESGRPSGSAVNIMTVHRAKGLEFPVVVVPEAHRNRSGRSGAGLVTDRDGAAAVRYVPEGRSDAIASPGYDRFKEEEDEEDRREYMRLFYVAATRAMDHLVVAGAAAPEAGLGDIAKRWLPEGGGRDCEKFDKAPWLHQLQSWDGAAGHVSFRDAGPGAYPEAWEAEFGDGGAGAGADGGSGPPSEGRAAAGPEGRPAAGPEGRPAAGSEGRPAAGSEGRPAAGPECSAQAAPAAAAARKAPAGIRPEMIRPLPPSQSWTGPVTAYARLLAEEGAGGEADGAPYAAWASDGGLPDGPEGEDGWASHEADRRLKSEAEGRGAKAVVPFPDALPPKDRGTVVHAVLEATDFAWDEGRYRAEALKAAASLGFRLSPEGAAALAGCLHRFQEGETGREVRDALASGRLVWREWPFWLRIDDDGRGRRPVTLSGTVDLLYMNAKDEAVLADYKLYRPADETVYRIQLGIYARALRQAGIAGDRIIERLCYLAG